MIEKAMSEAFWESADIFDLDEVRVLLRDSFKYIERETQIIYYTNFPDMIVAEESNSSMYNANDLKDDKKKV